jgi:hypothetical protein
MGTFAAPIGYALQGLGSIQEGYATQAGFEHTARQQRNQAIGARMEAHQTSAHIMSELDQVQDTIDVTRAYNGVEALSPSGLAFKQEQSEIAAMEQMRRVREFGYKELQSISDAKMSTFAGYAAVTSGWLSGLSSFAKSYAAAQSAAAGSGGGSPTPAAA